MTWLVFTGPAFAQTARWSATGEASAGYDSNIGNAPRGKGQEGSALLEAAGNLDGNFALGEYASLLTRASLRVQGYARENGLANEKLAGLARLSLRPGSSLFTPSFIVWASAADSRYASELRDGDELRGGLAVLQRLNTQFSARLSASASGRDAVGGAFDLRNRGGAFDLDWTPAPRVALHLGYQQLRGDTVATTEPDPVIAAKAKAKQIDDAFAGVPARIAYRFAARTQVGTLGCNYALSHALSLDGQLQYVETRADHAGVRYERWIATAGVLWRY